MTRSDSSSASNSASKHTAAYRKRQKEKGKKPVSVWLDGALADRIDELAHDTRMSKSEIIAVAIEEYAPSQTKMKNDIYDHDVSDERIIALIKELINTDHDMFRNMIKSALYANSDVIRSRVADMPEEHNVQADKNSLDSQGDIVKLIRQEIRTSHDLINDVLIDLVEQEDSPLHRNYTIRRKAKYKHKNPKYDPDWLWDFIESHKRYVKSRKKYQVDWTSVLRKLNDGGHLTSNGKPWKMDNLRGIYSRMKKRKKI